MDHGQNKNSNGTRSSRTRTEKTTRTEEIASLEEFRAKYLPQEERKHAIHHMTPEQIGHDLAQSSLTTAKESLAE